MISAKQFIASKGLNEAKWLQARKTGVSATTVAKASTKSGFKEVMAWWWDSRPVEVTPYMQFGLDSEPWLAEWAKDKFDLMPNDWLIRHESDSIALATPDGLSLDHSQILEVKTTGTDWGSADKAPIQYRRQVQWQLYVTGAESCVLLWMLRDDSIPGVLQPAWMEPEWGILYRDEKMIAELVNTARELWFELTKEGK